MKKTIAGSLILALLTACREDARIADMEALAERACACETETCAAELAPRILNIRGLEQENHANLPADLIARYDRAWARATSCLTALSPTLRNP
ncbi:hypothetical protein [Nioella sediminis]|jgi:hypothetical protein|uniref:hypothetical protein n=1 Tax=Nioella sediminis TaxID=1912092 RepID=UPI0008FCFCB7|nr:hypothetical protein [Nioella sediminis]TBX27655.1 hypothetical protein TK43_10080 [Roseovarius sp. JS7-11]